MEQEKTNIGVGAWKLPSGNVEVETKDGVFEIADTPYDRLEPAIKRAKGDLLTILSAVIYKKDGKEGIVGELDMKKFRSSTIFKIQKYAFQLLELQEVVGDFLKQQEGN